MRVCSGGFVPALTIGALAVIACAAVGLAASGGAFGGFTGGFATPPTPAPTSVPVLEQYATGAGATLGTAVEAAPLEAAPTAAMSAPRPPSEFTAFAASGSGTPAFAGVTPLDGQPRNPVRPLVEARVESPDPIDAESAWMTLDDAPVAVDYQSISPTEGVISFEPTQALAADTTPTIAAGIADADGDAASVSWSFGVSQWPDMDWVTDQNAVCVTCHVAPVRGGFTGQARYAREHETSKWFDDQHSVHIRWEHQNFCYNCHGDGGLDLATRDSACHLCHGFNGQYPEWKPYGTWYYDGAHGGSFDYTFRDRGNGEYRVVEPRVALDCTYCHQEEKTSVVAGAHDMDADHTSGYVASNCPTCHSDVLTREHAADGRTTAASRAIGCVTCHESPDPTVTGAIPDRMPYRARGYDIDSAFRSATGRVTAEYRFTAGRPTGANVTAFSAKRVLMTVEGEIEGSWMPIWSNTVTGWYEYHWFGDPAWWPTLLPSVADQWVDFPAPIDAVRVRFSDGSSNNGFQRLELKLDDWTFESTAMTDCLTCHTEPAEHVLAHGVTFSDECAACHTDNLLGEHESRGASCAACHDSADAAVVDAISSGSTACGACHAGYEEKHDLSAPAVSLDSCRICHWQPRHFGDDCQRCHPPFPADAPYYDPDTYTPYGYFESAASLQTSADDLHRIHVPGSWLDGIFTPSGCDSCHAPAACQACHGEVAHGEHARDQETGTYASAPVNERVSSGTWTSWRNTARVVSSTCVSADCHVRASVGTDGFSVPDCAGCHG